MMRASGLSRRALRIAWRAWRVASAVTAQVLKTIASVEAAFVDLGAHHFRLIDIEPAAKGDDARFAHASTVRCAGSTPSNS